MFEALSTPHNRTLTIVFLVFSCVSAAAAFIVGISDNPPGILLAFGAMIALVLAFVHPWRTAKQFRRLLYASVLGLVLFTILHNVFEAVAGAAAQISILQSMLQGLGVAAFLLAVFICPTAFLVGAIGSVVMFFRNRRRPTSSRDSVA